MTWYFAAFTWIFLTVVFHACGVFFCNRLHRRFPLSWYEVAGIMAVAVAAWWLSVNAFVIPISAT